MERDVQQLKSGAIQALFCQSCLFRLTWFTVFSGVSAVAIANVHVATAQILASSPIAAWDACAWVDAWKEWKENGKQLVLQRKNSPSSKRSFWLICWLKESVGLSGSQKSTRNRLTPDTKNTYGTDSLIQNSPSDKCTKPLGQHPHKFHRSDTVPPLLHTRSCPNLKTAKKTKGFAFTHGHSTRLA